jgi:MYXO-CTERM domain-containing protein
MTLLLAQADHYDYFGHSVVSGDLDDDGVDEVYVGSIGNEDYQGPNTVWETGTVTAWPDSSADPVVLIPPGIEPGDGFGTSIAVIPDLNGDGYDDLVVGAPGRDVGVANSGAIYLILGSANGPDMANAVLVTPLDPGLNAAFGESVAAAGDVNCDGQQDVIVGARWDPELGVKAGAAYVFSWGPDGLTQQLKLTDPDGGWGQWYGDTVSGAGNADGVAGDPNNCDDVVVVAGATLHVYFGHPDWSAMAPSLTVIGPPDGGGAGFGSSVAPAGDLNGDGLDDLLVGAPNDSGAGFNAGVIYVLDGDLVAPLESGFDRLETWDPTPGGIGVGSSVAMADDVDFDGIPDVIGGAAYSGVYGAAYVFYDQGVDRLDTFPELNASYVLGSFGAVVAAGDWDGDGHDDVFVGAPAGGQGAVLPGMAFAFTEVGCPNPVAFHADTDGDGFGDPAVVNMGCNPSTGWVQDDTDCDDTDPGANALSEQWPDADGDGYGCETCASAMVCGEPAGWSFDASDCDDDDPEIHPAGIEVIGDGVDTNCDGQDNPANCGGGCATGPGRSGWALALVFLVGLALRRRR